MGLPSAQTVFSKPASQDVQALKQVFASIDHNSCPYTFNFHMHTRASDGQFQPEALAQQAVLIGLKGFAITDHHSVKGYEAAQQYFNQNSASSGDMGKPILPHLWTGIEITSELLDCEVHILGYAFDPLHLDMEMYLQGCGPVGDNALADTVISAIHAAGGVAVLAHPARYRRPAKDLIPAAFLAGIDGVEAYYAYKNPNPWHSSPEHTSLIRDLANTYGLLCTCGTDTHGLSLLQRL
jgi:predicted metal-dependent phosphoesterase TrpH